MTRPKQDDLPGMEDKQIKALHEAALEYVQIRDKRMALTQEETAVKAKVLGLMKRHGKQAYRYNGVEIEIVSEQETVKVRVKQDGEKSEESESNSFRIFFADGTEREIEAGNLKGAKAAAKKQAAQAGTTLERIEEASN